MATSERGPKRDECELWALRDSAEADGHCTCGLTTVLGEAASESSGESAAKS